MTERLQTICDLLVPARVFADVGCDHGYCTRYMFDAALCERAYLTDISAESLAKAERLMRREIEEGRCVPVVCDGLEGVREPCDLVLIAGMGGEETIRILDRAPLPAAFVLQPMKNAEKVRRYLVGRGAAIERDFTFGSRGKYYDVLRGRAAGGDRYTERELRYGRDNLRGNAAFLNMMKEERDKLAARLPEPMKEESRAAIAAHLSEAEEVIHETERNLLHRR